MTEVNFTDNSAQVLSDLKSKTETALEKIGMSAEGYAKLELENDPRRIDTGRLRNSIAHTVSGNDAYIGTNVEYGIYVHEGTRRMAPNRFLKNAVEKNAGEYMKMAEETLKG